MEVRFRPLPLWPTRATLKRRALGGDTTYAAILERLKTELRYLKAENVVIETGHRETDIRQDGFVRSNARVPSHPGVVLWFHAGLVREGKPIGGQKHAMDTYTTWQDNLRAIVLRLEALRAVDRYGGIGEGGQQYKGYAALPQGAKSEKQQREAPKEPPRAKPAASAQDEYRNATGSPLKFQDLPAHEQDVYVLLKEAGEEYITRLLIVQTLKDPDRLRAYYRRAAKAAHPDAGGDHERFVKLGAAWERIEGRLG